MTLTRWWHIGRQAIRYVFLFTLAGLAIMRATEAAETPRIFRIGTASKAGTFYPIGTIVAKAISDVRAKGKCDGDRECGVRNLLAIAQVSNGSVANVEAVSAGQIEAGFAQADVVFWAYTATGRFKKSGPLKRLRVVANLFPGSLHIVTSAKSGINRVKDLVSKIVALDEPGSGTLATAELILGVEGIKKNDLSPLYIKHHHAGPMLAQGKLHAFFFVAGFPTRSVVDVSKKIGIKLVPLDDRTIEALVSERPYFARGVIPARTYKGISKDIPTVDIGTQFIVRDDLDEQLVYDITAALWSSRTRQLLDKGHPKGVQVQLKTALQGVGIPLHPGAARFYREVGLLKQ